MERLVLHIPLIKVFLWFLFGVIALAVALPSVFLIVWSIFGTETVGVLSKQPSISWFLRVLSAPEWRESIAFSVILGCIISGVGCLLLSAHFFFLRYSSSLVERVSYFLTITPVILPGVIYALALKLFGASIGLSEQLLLGIGHLVFVLPVQYFVLETAQESVPTSMLFAASTLGATPVRNLIFVYLPSIRNTLKSCFLVGFFFSFDEIIVAAFVLDSPLVTVPKRLWDEINRNMDPNPAVIATLLLIGFSFLLFVTSITSLWRQFK